MEIEILRTFQAVARHKSITKAAKEMYMSGSTVTSRIKSLEDALGTQLFIRTGRKMEPTEAALYLLNHLERFMNIVEEGREKIQASGNLLAGDLNLAAHPIVASYVLPALLKRMCDQYPMINLKLSACSNFQVFNCVNSGKAELGIMQGEAEEEGFTAVRWFDDDLIPIFSPDHPLAGKKRLTPSDLSEWPLLAFETRSVHWQGIRQWFAAAGIVPVVQMEINQVETIKRLLGPLRKVAFLPAMTVREELEQRVLSTAELFPPLSVKWSASFIFRSQSKLSKPARIFLDFSMNS